MKFKIGGLQFWKVFYHLKILGCYSGFCTIDDLPLAHWDETEFRQDKVFIVRDNEIIFVFLTQNVILFLYQTQVNW